MALNNMKNPTWKTPIILNALSVAGLFFALLGDKWADIFCWFALSLLCISVFYYGLIKQEGVKRSKVEREDREISYDQNTLSSM